MEQLDLAEVNTAPRQPASGEMPFKPISEGFQLQYAHQNGRLY
jgi:hypothetical protein